MDYLEQKIRRRLALIWNINPNSFLGNHLLSFLTLTRAAGFMLGVILITLGFNKLTQPQNTPLQKTQIVKNNSHLSQKSRILLPQIQSIALTRPNSKTIQFPDLGIAISSLYLNLTIKPGETKKAFSIISFGARQIYMRGDPTNAGSGISWVSDGNNFTGNKPLTFSLHVKENVSPGTYRGKAIILVYPAGLERWVANIEVNVLKKYETNPANTTASSNPGPTQVPVSSPTPQPTPFTPLNPTPFPALPDPLPLPGIKNNLIPILP